MKCPILPNWSFRKDCSCKREFLCDPENVKICKPIRKERVAEFKEIIGLRDEMKKSLPSIRDASEQEKAYQKLKLVEAQISEMYKR